MAEQLLLEAAVVDKFSGPLKKLRTDLQNVKPPRALEDVTRNFEKFRQSVELTSKSVTGGFNQAVTGLGLSSLGAIGSIAGVTAAVKKLASGAIELKQFERQTGYAADELRRFKKMASEFGADGDSLSGAVKGFWKHLYDYQVRNDPGAFSELANAGLGHLVDSFKNADIGTALGKLLDEAAKNAEQGPKGVERARRMLGAADAEAFLPFVLRGRKALADAIRNTPVDVLPADAEEKAIAFERAFRKIEEGAERLGRTLTVQLVEPLTKGLEIADKIVGKLPAAAEKVSPGGILENSKRELNSFADFGDKIRRFLGINLEPYGKLGAAPGSTNPALQELKERLQDRVRKGVTEGLEDFHRMNYSGGAAASARVWNASYGGGGFDRGSGDAAPSAQRPQSQGIGGAPDGDFGLRGRGGGRFNGLGGLDGSKEPPAVRSMREIDRNIKQQQNGLGSVGGDIPQGKAGKLSANQRESYAAALGEGLSPKAARALVADLSGESLRDPRNHHYDVHHMSQGIAQWDPRRAAAIAGQFGKEPRFLSVGDQTRAAIWEMRTKSRFASTWRALHGDNARYMMDRLVRNYEAPQNPGGEIAKRSRIYAGLGNLEKSQVADRRMRRSSSLFDDGDPGANRGRVADPSRLDVHFHNAPQGVRTKSDGKLIRDIRVNRGRAMVAAGQDA